MHWEGKTPRMLPEDFAMGERFEQGVDWPLSYDQIEPFYERAEREIGVSADVEDQSYLGLSYKPGYVFPMRGMPLSYLDKTVAKGVDGTPVELDGEHYELKVRPFPQGRNGIPNPAYDEGRGFTPVGAVSTSQVEEGGRCQGNINCVPICPVQAKYNAGKTLAKALQTGRVDLLAQSVASKVVVDPDSGRVTHVEYRTYGDNEGRSTRIARGRLFVICANAIETPRLMLASGLKSTSGLMGRNLMDHAYLLSWALLPEVAGTMRGTVCTGGISDLRGGGFRRRQAAFAVDIHNDGWGWATGSPYTDLLNLVDNENRFGADLRRELVQQISRQLLLAFMVEVPPSPSKRVTVDASFKTSSATCARSSRTRSRSTRCAVSPSRASSRAGSTSASAPPTTLLRPLRLRLRQLRGPGVRDPRRHHLAGTHIMGTSPHSSVVDAQQRSWDHQNLYLVGGGSMPSVGHLEHHIDDRRALLPQRPAT